MSSRYHQPTLAIGGLGGSGTRAIAQLFSELGYFMGYDLNLPMDNLLYTLLFKRKNVFLLMENELKYRIDLFYKILSTDELLFETEFAYLERLALDDNPQHSKEWLLKRVDILRTTKRQEHSSWAWKEPNTHLIIDKFLKFSPNLKFIYVYRNGLDMAYSLNQNQLRFFGDIFLNEEHVDITPTNALKYWCKVHKRVQKLAESYPYNIYLLDFDNLCKDTNRSLKNIFSFMGLSDKLIEKKFEDIFQLPSSYERYQKYPFDNFDNEDLKCLNNIYNIRGKTI